MPSGVPNSRYTQGPKDPEVNLAPEPPAPTISELEVLRQELAELRRAQANTEDRNQRLASELKENQRLVQSLMESGQSSIDLVALEAKWRAREAARRRIYARLAGKKVVIQLINDKNPNLNYAVHVNHNGNWYNVPRGKPFEIESEFLEVLDHAMVQTLARELDIDGNPHTVLYDLFNYPYQVLRGLEECEQADVVASAA